MLLKNVCNPEGERNARPGDETTVFPVGRKGSDHVQQDAQLQVNDDDDAWISRIREGMVKLPQKYPDFTEREGRLYRKIWPRFQDREENAGEAWKLCVPRTQRKKVLEDNHDAPTAGHPGIHKTYDKIARLYYWPTLYKDVARYVRQCERCARHKVEQRAPYGQMLRRRQVSCPFGTVTTDFVEALPRSSRGNRYIVVFQDNFTKWVEVRALPTHLPYRYRANNN
jgi:hypothetical protein